jgi:ribonuclease D
MAPAQWAESGALLLPLQQAGDPPRNHEWDKFEEWQKQPSAEAFEGQIMKYRRLEEQVKDMASSKVMGGLKVDAK